jgi:sigma-B regulation protein RsbU (phosphoserine phosphatase)
VSAVVHKVSLLPRHLTTPPRRLTAAGPPPAVGFLLDCLDDSPYEWAVLRGAMAAAHERGARLLCFAGGVLGAPCGEMGERNGVFDLARSTNVDALVALSGSIGKRIGADRLRVYCERFRPMPVCSIAVELENMSSVCIDNESGMRAAVDHVVQVHGKKRVAFVRGPEGNADAEQRYRVYVEALRQNGLAFAHELVMGGDFERASGRRAVEVLLGERALQLGDVGALVAANDMMALGALEALAERGVRVPGELAVVGFDDVDDARSSLPPLTTVRQPLYEQGRDAVRVVLEQLAQGGTPQRVSRHTELVVRNSCGCTAGFSATRSSFAPPQQLGLDAVLVRKRQVILAEISRAARGQMAPAGFDWAERLLNAFGEQMRGDSPDAFVRAYDDLLRRLALAGADLSVCTQVVSALRSRVVRAIASDPQRRGQAEDLFHEARAMTANVVDRVQAKERMHAWRSARALGRASAAIASGGGLAELGRAVSENLPELGIARCFLAEFRGGSGEGRTAQLVLVQRPGATPADPSPSEPCLASEIIRKHVLPHMGEQALCVLPITMGDEELGFVVLELGAVDRYLYETLRDVFTAVLARPAGNRVSALPPQAAGSATRR